jgi:Zn-dependent protease
LAGPIAQLILGGLTIALAVAIGYDFPLSNWLAWLFGVDPGDLRTIGDPTIEPTLYAMISFIIFPSVAWALLNLLPVLPLDGGRIAQHLLTIFQRRDGLYEATILSIVVGVLAAMWGFQNDRQFMGIMFLMLAFSNFQNLRGNIGGY